MGSTAAEYCVVPSKPPRACSTEALRPKRDVPQCKDANACERHVACCLLSRRPIARMGHRSQDRLPAVLVKCITHKNTICPLLKHCATAAALPTTLTPDNALTIVCLVPLSTLECPLSTSERTHCRRRLTMRAAAA